MIKQLKRVFVGLAFLTASLGANAQFAGDTITGTLGFGLCCGPAFGQFWLPNTMVVGSTSFYYIDGANEDKADMTAGGVLSIVDTVFSNANGWEMTFTNPNFGGASLLSSNFLGSGNDISWSFTGNTLTVDWLGTGGPGLYQADFQMTAAVPEPETYAMLLAGLGLLGFVARRRKQKLAAA